MGPKPRTVILTGAGISAESGIQTFRDPAGLWEKHRIEDVATPAAWQRNPALVQDFYNARRRQLLQEMIKPNPAHMALARLERALRDRLLIVTQNIDNLHERAGTRNIIHMHGELLKARCTASGQILEMLADMALDEPCGCCNPPAILRPHVVWFGEMPLAMQDIHAALSSCDLFVSIGTSGSVYPAAGFVDIARQAGAQTLELNLIPSQGANAFHSHRHGPASVLVPAWVDECLAP